MHIMVFRMYLSAMQELYDLTDAQLVEKSGEEYEDCLDTLANIRAHMAFTKGMIKEFEKL